MKIKPISNVLSWTFKWIRVIWNLLTNSAVSGWSKIIPIVSVIYLINPFDFIHIINPRIQMVLCLGQLDDLLVMFVLNLVFILINGNEVEMD